MERQSEIKPPLSALYLENSPKNAEVVRELLAGPARVVNLDCAATGKEFRSFLDNRAYDVILIDFEVPGFDGFASLRLASDIRPETPVICISGAIGEDTAVELLKAGAVDHVLKDRLARLPAAIERAVAGAKERAAQRQAAEALREAKQEMKDLLYITSHDLRSPLVNIQGFSQKLSRDLNELREALKPAALPQEIRAAVNNLAGEQIPTALAYITESALRINQLITALLKVSRLGCVEMSPEVLDTNAVLRNVLDTMRFQLEEAGAEVKIGDLPPCKADTNALNHILTNLLCNAVKYRDKSRRLEIKVRGEKTGPAAALYAISDNGIGIKASALKNIWRVFSGGDTPGVKKGEGIGLAMCRIMAEKNGGRVWVESEEGKGSEFFVEMPV